MSLSLPTTNKKIISNKAKAIARRRKIGMLMCNLGWPMKRPQLPLTTIEQS